MPEQIDAALVVAVTAGKGFTVITCCVAELVHVPVEPCILYVVVVVGLTLAPLVIVVLSFHKV